MTVQSGPILAGREAALFPRRGGVSVAIMIDRSDIVAAANRIDRHVRHTPLVRLAAGELTHGGPVTLKLELLQHAGSFKPPRARAARSTGCCLPPCRPPV